MNRNDVLQWLALDGLERAYDPDQALFRASLVLTPKGVQPVVRHSLRYSAMAAAGLAVAQRRGLRSARLPRERILARLAAAAEQGCDELNLALILWAHACADSPRTDALLSRAAETYTRLQGWFTSMALGWYLAAVEHTLSCGRGDTQTAALADRMAADLLRYQRRTGLFCMRAWRPRRAWAEALVERRIGTFANHIYSIYALSLYAARTQEPRAAQAVRRAVEAVCRGQGPQGQWWWMADTRTGAWVDQYPVYAVHQDAMAFFGLHAARPFTSVDVDAHLARGLDWLWGDNELRESLVEAEARVIWRAIQRKDSLSDGEYGVPENTLRRRRLTGLGLGFLAQRVPRTEDLMVLRESRTYHLGWVLFAGDALAHVERSAALSAPAEHP